MTAKHTPGPLTVTPTEVGGLALFGPNGRIAMFNPGGEAYARLFAEAPAMRAALATIIELWENDWIRVVNHTMNVGGAEAMGGARALLARIDGTEAP